MCLALELVSSWVDLDFSVVWRIFCELLSVNGPWVCFGINLCSSWASLVTQLVKNLPAVQEIPVPILSRAVFLEKG